MIALSDPERQFPRSVTHVVCLSRGSGTALRLMEILAQRLKHSQTASFI